MPAETHLFLCLKDNYGVLLRFSAGHATGYEDMSGMSQRYSSSRPSLLALHASCRVTQH